MLKGSVTQKRSNTLFWGFGLLCPLSSAGEKERKQRIVGEVFMAQAWKEHTSLLPTMHWLRLSLTIPSCKGGWETLSVCVPRKKRKWSGECTAVWATGLNKYSPTARVTECPVQGVSVSWGEGAEGWFSQVILSFHHVVF